jgi:hypothetical protein
VTPILARSMTWVELAGGTSIVFDLRIAAVAGESEAETNNRFVAEAIKGRRIILAGTRGR